MRVDPRSHNLTSLRNGSSNIELLGAHGCYRANCVWIRRLLSISRIICDWMVCRQGNADYIDRVLGKRISANKHVCYLPIILEIMICEKLYGLRAAGKWVGLYLVVKERAVLLPYFVCLVYAIQTIVFTLHHFNKLSVKFIKKSLFERKIYLSRRKHFSRLLELLVNFLKRKLSAQPYMRRFTVVTSHARLYSIIMRQLISFANWGTRELISR